jgi:hypothetical protein
MIDNAEAMYWEKSLDHRLTIRLCGLSLALFAPLLSGRAVRLLR